MRVGGHEDQIAAVFFGFMHLSLGLRIAARRYHRKVLRAKEVLATIHDGNQGRDDHY